VKLFICFAFFMLLAALSIGVAEWGKTMQRADIVQSWNDDSAQYVATGPLNTNILVTLMDNDNVSCDAYVSSVKHDRVLSKQLRDLGFKSVQCLTHREELQ